MTKQELQQHMREFRAKLALIIKKKQALDLEMSEYVRKKELYRILQHISSIDDTK
jgi:hypothetical protein